MSQKRTKLWKLIDDETSSRRAPIVIKFNVVQKTEQIPFDYRIHTIWHVRLFPIHETN